MEEDSGNENGKGKNDESKDDNDDMKGIGGHYSIIKGSNTRGKGY